VAASSLRPLAALALVLSLGTLAGGEAALEGLWRLDRYWDPSAPAVCPFKAATGLPCVGCGGTHAFARAARGDLVAALGLNPLGAWAGLAAWIVGLGAAAALVSGRGRWLAVPLGTVVTASPVIVLVCAIRWWMSLPAGLVLH
jgi:hypothetical protein